MKILGLDLGTRTGWALRDTKTESLSWGASGVLKYMRRNVPMVLEERLSAFEADLIYRLIGPDGPNVIVYEIAHMRGGPATRSALGMETVLRLAAYKSGIHLHGLHSATLKKFTTGDGKADKSLMIKHARLITENYVIEDDNEADAICLANWGEENGVETEWGAVEFAKRVSTKKKKKPNTTAKQKE